MDDDRSVTVMVTKLFFLLADLTEYKDEKNRSSKECSSEKQKRTKKVKILKSAPSKTMASSDAKSISRPQSITVDSTSKCGNKKSARYVQIDNIRVFIPIRIVYLFECFSFKMVALLSFWWYKWF